MLDLEETSDLFGRQGDKPYLQPGPDQGQGVEETPHSEGGHHREWVKSFLIQHFPLNSCNMRGGPWLGNSHPITSRPHGGDKGHLR